MGATFLYNEINAFCIFIILLMAVKSQLVVGKNAYMYYVTALISTIWCILMDSIWYIVDANIVEVSVGMKYFVYSVYFISFTIFGYFAYLCVEYLSNTHANSRVNVHYIAFGLIPVHGVLLALNYFFGFIFFVNEKGIYSRGPLFVLQYSIVLFYIVVACVRLVVCLIKGKTCMECEKYFSMLLYPILPIVAHIIQMYIPSAPLISIALTASSLILYVDLTQNVISLDPMTGLNNKKQFKNVLRRKMAESERTTDLYVLMVDIDKFKQINDTYGHLEGDKAIIRTASALRAASMGTSRRTTLSRFGGDEFVALLEYEKDKQDEAFEEIRQFCARVRQSIMSQAIEACVPYDLRVSIGVAVYGNNMKNADDFIGAADSDLYVKKREKEVNIAGQVTVLNRATQG
ncbi:MAG: GGDEF domain-containing protein [Butyrivibrio sp.]|nr:GGDEF domain-containing protein [Butyrivibrio sp.]